MEIISAGELFKPGCENRFNDIKADPQLAVRIKEITGKGFFIEEKHCSGRENWSHPSTMRGGMEAGKNIISSIASKKEDEDDARVMFFGENIRDSIKILRDFFRK